MVLVVKMQPWRVILPSKRVIPKMNNLGGVRDIKKKLRGSDVMQNYNTITNNNIIKDKVFEYLRSYSHALDDICKTRGQWRWTKREEAIAEQMIEAGVKIDAFMKEVIKVLNRCKKNRSRPPYTIAFFKSMWQNKVSKPKDTKQLIKGLVNKMNKRYDGV